MERITRSPISAYALGVAAPLLITLAVLALPHGTPGTAQYDYVYLATVTVVALVSGAGPAIVAALLSVALIDWFFVPPYGLAVAAPDDVSDLVLFMVVSVIVAALADSRRRQGRYLHQLSQSLLRSNIELEQRREDEDAARRAAVAEGDQLRTQLLAGASETELAALVEEMGGTVGHEPRPGGGSDYVIRLPRVRD